MYERGYLTSSFCTTPIIHETDDTSRCSRKVPASSHHYIFDNWVHSRLHTIRCRHLAGRHIKSAQLRFLLYDFVVRFGLHTVVRKKELVK